MKIAVIGTGYVGLVTSACLAESGNQVVGIDTDAVKINALENDRVPIYEPGLTELVRRNRAAGRLRFTTQYGDGVPQADMIFLAVGTPQDDSGEADLRYLWAACKSINQFLNGPATVVVKSTVPVGTNERLHRYFLGNADHRVTAASNPEFLKEGAALDDFMKPDRVVVGVREPETAERLRELYAPFLRTERPFLVMTPESAEMTKYVANAMLATKISFINEMANLCEQLDADINDVRRGIGHDQRIGFPFLFPGPGWGGSCFPKDIQALMALARNADMPLRILNAVNEINDDQKRLLPKKIRSHFGRGLEGKTVAIWGLAFKPRTDDIREAPALTLIDEMLAENVHLQVHDPEAMTNVRKIYEDRLTYCDDPYGALEGADGLAIVTEWQEFRGPDFARMRSLLSGRAIFDGRNLFEPETMKSEGFIYYSVGRKPVSRQWPSARPIDSSDSSTNSPRGKAA